MVINDTVNYGALFGYLSLLILLLFLQKSDLNCNKVVIF